LSGVRLDRLFRGKWVAAEGMIWETYDPARHLIDARLTGNPDQGFSLWKRIGLNPNGSAIEQEIRLEWFLGSHDYGTRNPGSMQVWGFDSENRMYLVAEHYHRNWDLDQWAERAVELYREFRYSVGVCDHAPAMTPVLNRRVSMVAGRDMPGLWRPWDKQRGADGEMTGINQVRIRFRQDAMYLVRGALRNVDSELRAKRKPTCLEQEILQFVYPITADGKRHKETPDEGCANHAADACRGAASWGFLKDLTPAPKAAQIPGNPGSIQHEFLKRRAERAKPKKEKNRW
jgi:hypothetical protein